jgi:hypothetical protein
MKLNRTTFLVLAGSLLVLGAVLYLLAGRYGLLQAKGRPVTISDGSLTVGSKNLWKDSSDDLKCLMPVGLGLVQGDYGWSVEYEYNDNQGPHRVDLSPADNQTLNLTIYYGDDTVSVTTDSSHQNLTICSQKYKFKKKFWSWKRYHSNDKDSITRVESCQPPTAACTYLPLPDKSVIGISYK